MSRLNLLILSLIVFGIITIPSLFTHAATDAVQINLSVTAAQGGGGDPADPIRGCTDATATNYNASAEEDDGSCEYPEPPETILNVTNLSAVWDDPVTNLTWQNPSFANFSAVRIVRGTTIPSDPNDGLLIYNGAGESASDNNVALGTRYYYAAFVRSTTGLYSSGAVASILIPTGDEEPPPPDEEPPPDDGEPLSDDTGPGDDGGGEENDPFFQLPQATEVDPLTELIKLGDFVFYQPGERQQFFAGNQDIQILGNKPLSVLIATEKLPDALKVIGLTIINPLTNQPIGSYLLKATADGLNYTASIGNAFPNGIYPLYISIINYRDQTMKRLAGRLIVTSGLGTPLGRVVATTQRILNPIAITVGLTSGLAQGLALVERIGSSYDLYLLILQGWGLLLRVLGLRRRPTPWGVVYDSVTKRPLDPAYVIIRQGEADKNTAITDLDGRYGFFLPANTYNIIANKTHYQFPSKKLAGRTQDELYNNLYFGEPFTTVGDEVVNRNIPLDPIAFDWNEFAKQAQGFFILHSRRQARRRRLFNALYVIGFLTGFYNLIFYPGIIAIVVMILYLLTFVARFAFKNRIERALTVKRLTGEPVPFAIIRAFMPEVNQEVKSVVADAFGRFFLLTPPGHYYITVEEKLPDETYRKIYQSPPIELKNGVLLADLIV